MFFLKTIAVLVIVFGTTVFIAEFIYPKYKRERSAIRKDIRKFKKDHPRDAMNNLFFRKELEELTKLFNDYASELSRLKIEFIFVVSICTLVSIGAVIYWLYLFF